MTSTRKPKMAITLGDPAGIGPETVIQAMASPLIHDVCDPFVIGHPDSLEAAARAMGVPAPEVNIITEPEQALHRPGGRRGGR